MQKDEDWLDDDPDFRRAVEVEYHKERQDVQRKRKGLADLHRQFLRKGAADMRQRLENKADEPSEVAFLLSKSSYYEYCIRFTRVKGKSPSSHSEM